MTTLTVEREHHSWYNRTTILKDSNGKVKAVIGSNIRQPKYGKKEIVINGYKFALDWSKVVLPKRK